MKLFSLALLAGTVLANAAIASDRDENSSEGELKLRPTLSAAIGYDSNPESDVDPEGDFFHEEKAALKFKRESDDLELRASLSAETREYFETSDSNSWNYEVKGSADYKLSSATILAVKASHLHEDDAGDVTINHDASVSVAHDMDFAELKSKASLNREDLVLEESNSDNKFDYVIASVENEAVLLPHNALAPFVRGKLSAIRHPNQDGSSTNRNANQAMAVAGLRYKIKDRLEANVGASWTHRKFKDASAHSKGFVEADVTWTPSDMLEWTASANRRFTEAGTDGSRVLDTREIETAATIKATDKFTFNSSLSLISEEEVRADEETVKLKLKNRASYAVTGNLSVFSALEQEWKKETDTAAGTSEKKKATVALIGVEAEL